MSARVVRLDYPPSLLSRPLVHDLVRRFELTVNILQAQITLEEGWIEIELTGADAEIERALDWVRGEGLIVTPGG